MIRRGAVNIQKGHDVLWCRFFESLACAVDLSFTYLVHILVLLSVGPFVGSLVSVTFFLC